MDEIKAMIARGESRSSPNPPEAEPMPESFWANAVIVDPDRKTSIHLRVDAEVYHWFKRQGPGHLTRMNAVLRAYYEAHRDKAKARSSRRRATGKAAKAAAE